MRSRCRTLAKSCSASRPDQRRADRLLSQDRADHAVHLAGRPLSFERYPDGIEAGGFMQKNASDYFPSWIRRARVAKEDGEVEHVVADDAATLAYLANQACVTLHVGLARVDRIHHPDRLVVDLDPSDDDFDKVKRAARAARRLIERTSLVPFVQTTGSRGLHVWVPLEPAASFDQVRAFAAEVADRLVARRPRSSRPSSARRSEGRACSWTWRATRTSDGGRALQRPGTGRGAGRDAVGLGRARRPRHRPDPLHDHQPVPPPRPQARPLVGDRRSRAAAGPRARAPRDAACRTVASVLMRPRAEPSAFSPPLGFACGSTQPTEAS